MPIESFITQSVSSSSLSSSSLSSSNLISKGIPLKMNLSPPLVSSGGGTSSFEADPSTFQFLQTAIQMIYKSRSVLYVNNNNQNTIDIDSILMSNNDPLSSISLSTDDLGELNNKDIHIESDEINEINRDLFLWCDHLDSTPLKLDIYSCTPNQIKDTMITSSNGEQHIHTLIERWIFSFKAKPIITHPQINELTISDELANIISPLGEISPFKQQQQQNNLNQNQNNDNQLLKCLYYLLPSMPLFKHLKETNRLNNEPKIKYGISPLFPPPINFHHQEYKNLIKLNFPIFETTRGTISLSVQFSNTPTQLNSLGGLDTSLIIYPSRSYSNLLCHPTSVNINKSNGVPFSNGLVNKSNLLPEISTTSTTSTSSSSSSTIKTPTNTSPHSTSPSSAPISIPRSTNNILINIQQEQQQQKQQQLILNPLHLNNNQNNNNHRPSSSSQPQYITESPSTPPQLSPHSFKYIPYSPNSPSSFNFRSLPSPPSSPIRVGHRPLFVDGIYNSPNSLGPSSSSTTMMMGLGIPIKRSNSQNGPDFSIGFGGSSSGSNGGGLSFGSFQESILSGNMANTPSTPFEGYLADLGVSGKDYLPPHKKIPFTAIYYHVDHETPYVSTIDLGSKGLFRISQKGLIQLTLFNPHKTPIKTFLVNYDLGNMPAETKTFIRQRIVSTTNNNNNGNEETSLLKYAIHLRFVSPKKRKYYLYKDIRVVFPNRLPDEMEKLKIIYEYPPEPKYFPYQG